MFKEKLYEICANVAADFEGWSFGAGIFKNKSLKHTDLKILPGFGFDQDNTPLGPAISLQNKRTSTLCKRIIGYDLSTSLINFQVIAQDLHYMPEHLRLGASIFEDKKPYIAAIHASSRYDDKMVEALEQRALDLTDVRPILTAMMREGTSLIQTHYDLSSEENLLRALPAKYSTRHPNSPYDEMEKQKGVVVCLVHILLGDFDFVVNYRSNDYKTIFPKRIKELDAIIAALPELKRRYAETGSPI